ncbi:FAD dependent oxidoreductase [Aspergillus campestris IBT 28561]|uniref:FAD dependent oxidoreductase n=1 Tax=Aspergillus campestris (strain IBT 28561) TaxID=1392248 RepID=A0A2I1CXV1_ASPC2|nr:FAD dependent oxidoreductase [Aspergillus campestris IBT 28561]PKY02459.1 FAD dependent oxidoreductase [Aspergillus campestris IBT 28561]
MTRSFPSANGTVPFWRTEPQELDNFQSTPNLPEESDIVIIGGGYSAAALVTHIQKQYPNHPSILVLEARQLCSGASGRNGGHIKPDPYFHASDVAAQYGPAAGAEVADFEVANLKAAKEYIEREGVDCDFVLTRAIDVHFSSAQDTRIKERLRGFKAAGVAAAQEVSEVAKDHAEIVSGVKGAQGCISFTAAHLWPYKLIHHMFTKALNHGGLNLQTNTLVNSVSPAPDSQSGWAVQTSRGTVKASKVIMASNSYTSSLLPEYKEQIIPYRGVSCHITTPGPAPLLVNTYALRFKDWDFDYLIPRPDGTIVVGGARSAYFRKKDLWYDNTNDDEVIEETRRYFDGYMQRNFRGWEKSGAEVSEIWTGIMGYSRDKLPRLGPVPDRPGMFIMAGWTGHGMPQIFLAAKGMAEMIVGDVSYRQTGLPRVFEETADRLQNAPNKVLESWYQATQGPRL